MFGACDVRGRCVPALAAAVARLLPISGRSVVVGTPSRSQFSRSDPALAAAGRGSVWVCGCVGVCVCASGSLDVCGCALHPVLGLLC